MVSIAVVCGLGVSFSVAVSNLFMTFEGDKESATAT